MSQGKIGYLTLKREGSIGKKSIGIWLKNTIMYNNELSLVQKVICSIIQGFQKGDKDCFVSDNVLALICSCDRRTISRNLNALLATKTIHKRFKRVNGEMKRILWIG